MALTVIAVQNAKPRAKRYNLKDDRGLYLEISPAGGKWWRLRYWLNGRENRLSLGIFPDVTLAQARERRDEARRLLAEGIDPSAAKKASRAENLASGESFQAVAMEWFEKFRSRWGAVNAKHILSRLQNDVFPWIGAKPVREVNPPELLTVIRRIEARGAAYTAHRALGDCGRIFRYAVVCGKAERDPAADLRGALQPAREKHQPSITDPKELGDLLRAIDAYQGTHVVRCALKLAPLLFVRPGELRHAEWAEINLDAHEWRIPANKMKMHAMHIVPLSRQAVEVLKDLKPLTGDERYVFPGERNRSRPMSENTVNAALRYMGFNADKVVGHGFRSTASTLLNEQGWNRDAIERQLAHAERSKVRAAYNYAEYLPERRRMMQAWADYLDALKAGGRVLAIRSHRR